MSLDGLEQTQRLDGVLPPFETRGMTNRLNRLKRLAMDLLREDQAGSDSDSDDVNGDNMSAF